MSAEWLRELAARLRGRRVSGGCDECNTYQTLEEDSDLPGYFHIRIHHDHWCPFLARIEVN
jgi:hypothetical protein